LKRHRKAEGLTIQQAAQALAVNACTISAWERFKRLPSPKNVSKIIALIGFDPLQCRESQAKSEQ
jgi:transcriptional regulator with XRE-family HTH domain